MKHTPMMRKDSYERIVKRSAPCRLLSGVHHFHVDLYGNFIPQSCSGLSIKFSELFKGADPDKYPVFYRLETAGIKGLADLAVQEYGYKPKPQYAGQCDLCQDIRSFLALEVEEAFRIFNRLAFTGLSDRSRIFLQQNYLLSTASFEGNPCQAPNRKIP